MKYLVLSFLIISLSINFYQFGISKEVSDTQKESNQIKDLNSIEFYYNNKSYKAFDKEQLEKLILTSDSDNFVVIDEEKGPDMVYYSPKYNKTYITTTSETSSSHKVVFKISEGNITSDILTLELNNLINGYRGNLVPISVDQSDGVKISYKQNFCSGCDTGKESDSIIVVDFDKRSFKIE